MLCTSEHTQNSNFHSEIIMALAVTEQSETNQMALLPR